MSKSEDLAYEYFRTHMIYLEPPHANTIFLALPISLDKSMTGSRKGVTAL